MPPDAHSEILTLTKQFNDITAKNQFFTKKPNIYINVKNIIVIAKKV
jgi:hypothetical protein